MEAISNFHLKNCAANLRWIFATYFPLKKAKVKISTDRSLIAEYKEPNSLLHLQIIENVEKHYKRLGMKAPYRIVFTN
jgi:hypothetical protein